MKKKIEIDRGDILSLHDMIVNTLKLDPYEDDIQSPLQDYAIACGYDADDLCDRYTNWLSAMLTF